MTRFSVPYHEELLGGKFPRFWLIKSCDISLVPNDFCGKKSETAPRPVCRKYEVL